MHRTLTWINALAIPLLVGLCVLQWIRERALQLELRQSRIDLHELRKEHHRLAARLETTRADLDRFKASYRASEHRAAELRQELERESLQRERLAAEAAHLRTALTNWIDALQQREDQLRVAATRIQALNEQLMDVADRYRRCVTNYETLREQYSRMRAPGPPGRDHPEGGRRDS